MSPFGLGLSRLTIGQVQAQGRRSRYIAAALSLEPTGIRQRQPLKSVATLVVSLFVAAVIITALGLARADDAAYAGTHDSASLASDGSTGPPLSPPPPPPIPRAPPYPSLLDCGGYVRAFDNQTTLEACQYNVQPTFFRHLPFQNLVPGASNASLGVCVLVLPTTQDPVGYIGWQLYSTLLCSVPSLYACLCPEVS